MNYRHAYHAGNFADVVKHAVLARIIDYLKRKEAPFRVTDTHAGAGLYDLAGTEAARTGEWMTGIGRLIDAELPEVARSLLEPYLAIVRNGMADGRLATYPGSPLIARSLMRRQDRLSAFELHEEDFAALSARLAGDFQARVTHLDGWLVAGAHLPPKEKRGLVLIDPPFEAEGEFARMADALEKGHRRWPGGLFMLWYPLKHARETERFKARLRASALPDLVCLELEIGVEAPALSGCGLIIKNPPFVLAEELGQIMPVLVALLGRSKTACWRFDRLTAE